MLIKSKLKRNINYAKRDNKFELFMCSFIYSKDIRLTFYSTLGYLCFKYSNIKNEIFAVKNMYEYTNK